MIVVSHIIVGLNIGGAELMLKRLVKSHQDADRFRCFVISLGAVGPVGLQLRALGVEVHALNMRRLWDVPMSILLLVRLLRQQRPNIIQTWMYHADLLGGLAARMAGYKNVIWGIRTTDVAAGNSRAITRVRWLCARLSHWIPNTIVCAAAASRRAHVELGYCADRMVVVPNGFDLARLQATPAQVAELRLECGFASDAVVIGTLGRFNVVKDQYNFVRAAGLLARHHLGARFLMVGRDCDVGNDKLMDWINATGCANRFVLLGERSDAPVCLSAMDVFCLSSRTEGFPNVVGEAMVMRKACVVTDVGDAAYLLGNCGVVVPKENADALAEGMAKLVSLTDAERADLGALAHARIASEFTMERTRERFEAVYAKVLAGQAPHQLNEKNQE
jgi:glycosyltransferase involved in cell wall biosynthesis